jgi:hypothetical protein
VIGGPLQRVLDYRPWCSASRTTTTNPTKRITSAAIAAQTIRCPPVLSFDDTQTRLIPYECDKPFVLSQARPERSRRVEAQSPVFRGSPSVPTIYQQRAAGSATLRFPNREYWTSPHSFLSVKKRFASPFLPSTRVHSYPGDHELLIVQKCKLRYPEFLEAAHERQLTPEFYVPSNECRRPW